jgi:VanZ family protein
MRWGWLDWPASARRTATLAFLLFMNWLLLAPARTFSDVHIFLSHQDKIAHCGIFAALAGLVRWSVPAGWGKGRQRAAVILTLLFYGAAIECVQPLLPGAGRTFEWLDLLMDFIGVGMGVWLCERLARQDQ